jgi:hypothetical protein
MGFNPVAVAISVKYHTFGKCPGAKYLFHCSPCSYWFTQGPSITPTSPSVSIMFFRAQLLFCREDGSYTRSNMTRQNFLLLILEVPSEFLLSAHSFPFIAFYKTLLATLAI